VSETLLRHIKRLRAAGEPQSVTAVFEKEADASTQAMRRICHLFAATGEPISPKLSAHRMEIELTIGQLRNAGMI
jgi:hypothetical protein